MLEPVTIWRRTLKDIPTVDSGSWISNLGSWLFERTTGKLVLKTVLGPVTYTFNRASFEGVLASATPVDQLGSAAAKFASAWESGVLSSPMLVTPGCSLGAPSPATTWSVVGALIDVPAVGIAKFKLQTRLSTALAVASGDESELAEAFREAFLSLSYTLTGMNSLPIPTPLPSPFHPTA